MNHFLRILLTPLRPVDGADACSQAKFPWLVLVAGGVAAGLISYPNHISEIAGLAQKAPELARIVRPETALAFGITAVPVTMLIYGLMAAAVAGGGRGVRPYVNLGLLGSVLFMAVTGAIYATGQATLIAVHPVVSIWGVIVGVIAIRRISGSSWLRSILAEIVANVVGGAAGSVIGAIVGATFYFVS